MNEALCPVAVACAGRLTLHERVSGQHGVRQAVPGIIVAVVERQGLELGADISPFSIVKDWKIGQIAGEKIAAVFECLAVPFNLDHVAFNAQVIKIETNSIRELADPVLSSTHGGPIPARSDDKGITVPERPIYRVLLKPETGILLPRVALVSVNIKGEKCRA